jgi:hypothetical protein
MWVYANPKYESEALFGDERICDFDISTHNEQARGCEQHPYGIMLIWGIKQAQKFIELYSQFLKRQVGCIAFLNRILADELLRVNCQFPVGLIPSSLAQPRSFHLNRSIGSMSEPLQSRAMVGIAESRTPVAIADPRFLQSTSARPSV